MKSTPCESRRLPAKVQLMRVKAVMNRELTPLQRQTLVDCYLAGKSLTQIARERGVNKSTVCRMRQRAEEKLRRFLAY